MPLIESVVFDTSLSASSMNVKQACINTTLLDTKVAGSSVLLISSRSLTYRSKCSGNLSVPPCSLNALLALLELYVQCK